MNICITGALGHIGSELIRNLSIPSLKKVHLVDNFLTQRYSTLFNLPDKPRFIFHETDILAEEMNNIIKDSNVVVHLAAITDAESSVQKRDLVENVNKKVLNTLQIFQVNIIVRSSFLQQQVFTAHKVNLLMKRARIFSHKALMQNLKYGLNDIYILWVKREN